MIFEIFDDIMKSHDEKRLYHNQHVSNDKMIHGLIQARLENKFHIDSFDLHQFHCS